MKEKTIIVKIKVSNIEVDERYYSFDYIVTVNGKRRRKESFNDDYCNGQSPREWKNTLQRRLAFQIVMNRFNF